MGLGGLKRAKSPLELVAWMKRSGIREGNASDSPDSLHFIQATALVARRLVFKNGGAKRRGICLARQFQIHPQSLHKIYLEYPASLCPISLFAFLFLMLFSRYC